MPYPHQPNRMYMKKKKKQKRLTHVEELELVFEVLESGSDGIETLSLLNRQVIVFDPKILGVYETKPILMDVVEGFTFVGFSKGFDGIEKMKSGN